MEQVLPKAIWERVCRYCHVAECLYNALQALQDVTGATWNVTEALHIVMDITECCRMLQCCEMLQNIMEALQIVTGHH